VIGPSDCGGGLVDDADVLDASTQARCLASVGVVLFNLSDATGSARFPLQVVDGLVVLDVELVTWRSQMPLSRNPPR